jgi:hypothetical protein
MSYPSMDELNTRILRETISQKAPSLGKAEQREALRVAKAAYHGQTTCIEAVRTGVRYVKDKRENG